MKSALKSKTKMGCLPNVSSRSLPKAVVPQGSEQGCKYDAMRMAALNYTLQPFPAATILANGNEEGLCVGDYFDRLDAI